MEKITITIETVNEAFDDGNELLETAHILRQLAAAFENGNTPPKVRDVNGNTVGIITYE